jgi:hypothetical protein
MLIGEKCVICRIAASVLGGVCSITAQNAPVATSMARQKLRMVQTVRENVIMVASPGGLRPVCEEAAAGERR